MGGTWYLPHLWLFYGKHRICGCFSTIATFLGVFLRNAVIATSVGGLRETPYLWVFFDLCGCCFVITLCLGVFWRLPQTWSKIGNCHVFRHDWEIAPGSHFHGSDDVFTTAFTHVTFCSILFYSILFLFHSILYYSILFYFIWVCRQFYHNHGNCIETPIKLVNVVLDHYVGNCPSATVILAIASKRP